MGRRGFHHGLQPRRSEMDKAHATHLGVLHRLSAALRIPDIQEEMERWKDSVGDARLRLHDRSGTLRQCPTLHLPDNARHEPHSGGDLQRSHFHTEMAGGRRNQKENEDDISPRSSVGCSLHLEFRY